MKTPKQSGIYKIEHVASGRVYVGSAIDINRRWRLHKSDLGRNCHHSPYLQNCWNKHGSLDFAFSIIEAAPREHLIVREQFWLDYFKSYEPATGFNILAKAGSALGYKLSEESRKKISLSKQGSKSTCATFDEDVVRQARQMAQFGLDRREIAAHFGVNEGAIRNAVNGRSFKHVLDVAPVLSNPGPKCQISKENSLSIVNDLRLGEKVIMVAKKYNISSQTISDINLGKTHGHLSISSQKFPLNGIRKVQAQKLICVETGEKFNSITDAEKKLNIAPRYLSFCLKRNMKCKGLSFICE
jgi:group I intron endonuclease